MTSSVQSHPGMVAMLSVIDETVGLPSCLKAQLLSPSMGTRHRHLEFHVNPAEFWSCFGLISPVFSFFGNVYPAPVLSLGILPLSLWLAFVGHWKLSLLWVLQETLNLKFWTMLGGLLGWNTCFSFCFFEIELYGPETGLELQASHSEDYRPVCVSLSSALNILFIYLLL